MRPTDSHDTMRNRFIAVLDRNRATRRIVIGLGSVWGRARGGVRPVVDEAAELGDPRPLNRRLQMLAWAVRVRSGAPLSHFNPGDHLRGEPAREAAQQAIEQRTEPAWRRQLIGLVDDEDLDRLAQRVEADLRPLLADAAVRPRSRGAVDPRVQGQIVAEITSRLAAVGITPFLMSGTLLGVVRDGGFLPYDYDVDLGLLPDTELDSVAEALHDSFVVTHEPGRLVAERHGIHTDLFPHEERDGRWWHRTAIHEWWNTPFGLEERTVGAIDCWIPDDPERYLDENYGAWTNPVVFYDISFDTPNRQYRRAPEALRFLHSRVLIGLRDNDRWLVESSLRELAGTFGIEARDALAPSALLRSARDHD